MFPDAGRTILSTINHMVEPVIDYDARYLAGILFFNEQDFFEAHEVWESIWLECTGPERRFYQGLIQAAVGLYHFGNGNVRGAAKLYHSSRKYMEAYPSPYLGLDIPVFWNQMERCFAELLASLDPNRSLRPDADLIPRITLDPPPTSWPDPLAFVDEDE
jgi:predicted metal-dependent hydrolase